MPKVSLITLEQLSKARALSDFLEKYSAPEQKNLIAKQLLKPDMIQSYSLGEKGVVIISALAEVFPENRNEIVAKILHLDTFKILVQSIKDVEELINVFPDHKNGIATLVFSPEILKALVTAPSSKTALTNLFPELPEYKNHPHLLNASITTYEQTSSQSHDRFFSSTIENQTIKNEAITEPRDHNPDNNGSKK